MVHGISKGPSKGWSRDKLELWWQWQNNSGGNRSGWVESFGRPWKSWEHGNQLPGTSHPNWIGTKVASSVDSAFVCHQWTPRPHRVQSVLNRVVGGTSAPAPTPVPAPTPIVTTASERTSQDNATKGSKWECARRPQSSPPVSVQSILKQLFSW